MEEHTYNLVFELATAKPVDPILRKKWVMCFYTLEEAASELKKQISEKIEQGLMKIDSPSKDMAVLKASNGDLWKWRIERI